MFPGVWYYEVILLTAGVMQIGWATKDSKFLNHVSLESLLLESLLLLTLVGFPLRSKDVFFASCCSLIPFTRANAQWVIHGFR